MHSWKYSYAPSLKGPRAYGILIDHLINYLFILFAFKVQYLKFGC